MRDFCHGIAQRFGRLSLVEAASCFSNLVLERPMQTQRKRPASKPEPQVRFLGFSGTLMVFSDSPLIRKKEQKEPKRPPAQFTNPVGN
jgi:hypothetical protein